jgi:hypothetical protein
MKATERPGAAQVTATPRSVTAPRQTNVPSLQNIREAFSGAVQSPFSCQPETSERPSSQETPVTRTPLLEPPSQALALTPTGASCPGAVEVEAGGAALSPALVSSEEDPQPAAAIASATASAASPIVFGLGCRIGAI